MKVVTTVTRYPIVQVLATKRLRLVRIPTRWGARNLSATDYAADTFTEEVVLFFDSYLILKKFSLPDVPSEFQSLLDITYFLFF